MIRKLPPLFFGMCLTLAAAERVQVATTEHFEFARGGLVRLVNSTGELNVEGWDQPEVEVTVIKFTESDASKKDKATRELNDVQIEAKRPSDGELVISTTLPSRSVTRPFRGMSEVNVDYRIRVPKGTRLAIRHGIGDVVIFNVGADIDASTRVGGIVVQLPEPFDYAIDARSKMGSVFSDFAGEPAPRTANPHQIHLRVGIGGIEIQKMWPGNLLGTE